MNENPDSRLPTNVAGPHGGWIAGRVLPGGKEIWLAGGPGIGRLHQAFGTSVAAAAAIDLEVLRQAMSVGTLAKRMALRSQLQAFKKILEDDRQKHGVAMVEEETIDADAGISVLSVLLDDVPRGHLVARGLEPAPDMEVAAHLDEARDAARRIAGLTGSHGLR